MLELDTIGPRLDLFQEPERVLGSMTGNQFGSSIANMPNGRPRELAIFQQLSLGNIPSFLRRGIPIPVSSGEHQGIFWAMPDYLAIGDDSDFLRMPMRPTTAQKTASLFKASLPTRKMAMAIWKAMPIHLPFVPHGTKSMSSVATFGEHNADIQRRLAGRPPELGVAGHFKDVVICKDRPKGNVAIWGAFKADGSVWQGPQIQKSAHDIPYLDYSHGIRFVSEIMLVDDTLMYLEEVLTHHELHGLLSDEGQFEPEECFYSMEL